MKKISRKTHGIIDYLWAAIMISAPFFLGFTTITPAAACFFIAALSVFLLSLFTNYELGVWKRLPMAFHLDMDIVLGFILVISPWLFGFYNQIFLPHIVMGAFSIVAGLTSNANSMIKDG
ncbi:MULTISPECIES: SPW repeat protein [unclassified Pedobacter]|uniref:SPW repeat domain-containing protein n=1 Tax=unclassified Pedobacter TaxID=2628915 RepID=UPI001DD87282|nr:MULTISPECIES: SPW repeat protein [unclassified Pedobacter]CAH0126785.1 hypothetical protein SRABI36_00161 [Pedobacter sp. Bi36]CAH0180938.1 hypothetical protein SRABI126_01257 [Pedobacter sp. Bi126]